MSEANDVKIGKLEESTKSAHKRLDTHDVEIRELKNVYNALTKVDEKVKNVENDVQEIKTDMKEIKNKPAKKWDKLIDYIFYAVLGYLLLKLGLK